MAQMNGIEAAIQIRKLLPQCKVLLVSGDNDSSRLLQDALSRGYKFEILAKPVHPVLLFPNPSLCPERIALINMGFTAGFATLCGGVCVLAVLLWF